jgi:hypothetical protein
VQLGDQRRELGDGRQRRDLLEQRLQRRRALRIDGRLVEARRVVVADLL